MEGSLRLKKQLLSNYYMKIENNTKTMENIRVTLEVLEKLKKILQIEHLELESQKRNIQQSNLKLVQTKNEIQIDENEELEIEENEEMEIEENEELQTDPLCILENLVSNLYQGKTYKEEEEEEDSELETD